MTWALFFQDNEPPKVALLELLYNSFMPYFLEITFFIACITCIVVTNIFTFKHDKLSYNHVNIKVKHSDFSVAIVIFLLAIEGGLSVMVAPFGDPSQMIEFHPDAYLERDIARTIMMPDSLNILQNNAWALTGYFHQALPALQHMVLDFRNLDAAALIAPERMALDFLLTQIQLTFDWFVAEFPGYLRVLGNAHVNRDVIHNLTRIYMEVTQAALEFRGITEDLAGHDTMVNMNNPVQLLPETRFTHYMGGAILVAIIALVALNGGYEVAPIVDAVSDAVSSSSSSSNMMLD